MHGAIILIEVFLTLTFAMWRTYTSERMAPSREWARIVRTKYPWRTKRLSWFLALVMLVALVWFLVTWNPMAVGLYVLCLVVSVAVFSKLRKLEPPPRIDDRRTDRECVSSGSRVTRRVGAVLYVVLGSSFGAAGVLLIFHRAPTFGGFFMLFFGCAALAIGIIKYRRISAETNTFPTPLSFGSDDQRVD
jgi:hypothetical protein